MTMEPEKNTEEQQDAVLAEDEQNTLKANTKEKKPVNVKHEIFSWIVTILCAVALALVIRTLIFEPIRVDGHSMNYTLDDKEIVFVTKYDYILGSPENFDVIICHYPGRGNTNFVKRLIGMPGDTVQMDNGVLYLNGEVVEEPYLSEECTYLKRNATFGPLTLGEDEYFVMGDNRDNSNDSRSVGVISRKMIVGHVRFVFFPFGNIRGIE